MKKISPKNKKEYEILISVLLTLSWMAGDAGFEEEQSELSNIANQFINKLLPKEPINSLTLREFNNLSVKTRAKIFKKLK